MLSSNMSRRYPCAASWTTPSGSRITVTDAGICYGVEYNGDYIGAIDSAADLDEFATVNHYTEEGTTYVAL